MKFIRALRRKHASAAAATLAAAFLATLPAAEAATGSPDARAIMREVEDRADGFDSVARTVIEISDRFGETHSTTILRLRKDFGPDLKDQHTFSFVTDPPEMAGTRVLTKDYHDHSRMDDQWIMIPGIDEIKRIAVDSYTSKLMGSDITYGDLSSRDLDLYDFVLEGEEQVENWSTYVIDFAPRTQEEIDRFGYVGGRVWVDRESWLVVRSIFRMIEPGHAKLFMTHAAELTDGYWNPTDMTFITQIDGNVVSSTRMRLFEMRFDVGLPDDLFDVDALGRVDAVEPLLAHF